MFRDFHHLMASSDDVRCRAKAQVASTVRPIVSLRLQKICAFANPLLT